MDEEKIKEYIFQAVQSGKKETSNLAADILKKMQEQIEESVRTTVNGKIKAISHTLEDQNTVMEKHFTKVDDHMKMDSEWKNTYTPYIKGLASVSDGSKIMVYIIITIAAVGGSILAIRRWFT